MREAVDRPHGTDMPGGFGVIDARGRLTLTKAVREALRLRPGSSVAYIVIDNHLLVIPQDEQLAHLMDDAAAALARMGLTTDDLLADLPAAGDEAMRAAYGDDLVDEFKAAHARARAGRDE